MRFDAASLESGRVYHGIDAIPRGRNYNIILYFFESFPAKYLDLEVNGKAVVPNWNRLMRNAFVARNHYANFPLTANAQLSVFASAYDPVFKVPFDIGAAVKNSESLKLVIRDHPDIPLKIMPQILKERGYRNYYFHTWTLGYVGTRRFLRTRRFDEVYEMYQLRQASANNGKMGYGIDDRAMIEPGVRALKKDREKPFFAVFCPLSPHFPYPDPDKEYIITGPREKNATFEEDCRRKYINALQFSDAVLGMLVDRLEAEGLLENTLLFIVADHGQAFLEHKGNFRHRTGIYEENVHVPFLVYNRNLFPRPMAHDGITRHIDIAPTILDILGVGTHRQHQGVSLASRRRQQIAFLHTAWRDDYRGLREGPWKYIIRLRDGVEELYNLRMDPEERNNLVTREPGLCVRYRDMLAASASRRETYYQKLRSGAVLTRTGTGAAK